jgi:hypothetical protein
MRAPNLRPFRQGDDNGLCGLYAVVNAVRWLWPELRRKNEKGEEEIAALARHVVKDRLRPEQFQSLYLDGDELPLVWQIAQWAGQWLLNDGFAVELGLPFETNPPSDKRDYWARLARLIEPKRAVAIIGFNEPWPHWTVATNKAGRFSVRLFDSDVFETIDVRRTVIGGTDGKTWEIDPPAVIVLSRVC